MSGTELAEKTLSLFHGMTMQVFIIILLAAVVHYIEAYIYRRLLAKAKQTKTNWDEAVLKSIHKPLGVLIWFLGISYAIDILRWDQTNIVLYRAIGPIREIAVIAIIVWFLVRLIKQVEWVYSHPEHKNAHKIDKTTLIAVSQILRAAVFVTAVLIILQTMGYSISGVLTLGGVGGLVAGLAAQDLLANFFGGIMIYMDRPFKVGDWIRSPDRKIEGTVEYIGWRLCRIRTFDRRPLYVPNSVFSKISVENPSRMLNRRIFTHVGVRYQDASKVRSIVGDVKTMLQQHPEIDPKATLIVNLVEFGTSSLNFMVYTFTKTTDWIKFQEIQEDVFLKIVEIIQSHEAECAFPTSTVHVPDGIQMHTTLPPAVEETA